jgi:site-specific DNA-methyltransferase (adenine-specific)
LPDPGRRRLRVTPYYDDGICVIYHGDARDVVPALGSCADAVVTDPPYSVSIKGSSMVRLKGKGSTNLDFFPGDDDWVATTRMAVDVLAATVEPDRVRSIYAWCGHRQFGSIVTMLEQAGWSTRFLVWRKTCPIPAPPGSGWNSGAELCVYGYRAGRVWAWSPGSGPRSNVLDADNYRHGQPGKVDHPTQKPLSLMGVPLEGCTEPGMTVLDPFMGSGTTLVAAKARGRRSIGIEKEERYCEIAARRLAQGALDFGTG